MPWVFSYSDLSPETATRIFGEGLRASVAAILRDFEVVFKDTSRFWSGGIASIQQKRGSIVYGSAYLVDTAALELAYQYYTAFKAGNVNIELITGDEISCYVFYLSERSPYNNPSATYINAILDNLKVFWSTPSKKPELKDFGIDLQERVQPHQVDEAIEIEAHKELEENDPLKNEELADEHLEVMKPKIGRPLGSKNKKKRRRKKKVSTSK